MPGVRERFASVNINCHHCRVRQFYELEDVTPSESIDRFRQLGIGEQARALAASGFSSST
jgi:hypothetical protein